VTSCWWGIDRGTGVARVGIWWETVTSCWWGFHMKTGVTKVGIWGETVTTAGGELWGIDVGTGVADCVGAFNSFGEAVLGSLPYQGWSGGRLLGADVSSE